MWFRLDTDCDRMPIILYAAIGQRRYVAECDRLAKMFRRTDQIIVIFTPEQGQHRGCGYHIAAEQRSREREGLQAPPQHLPSELSYIGWYAVLAVPLIIKVGRCRNWTRQMTGIGLPGSRIDRRLKQ